MTYYAAYAVKCVLSVSNTDRSCYGIRVLVLVGLEGVAEGVGVMAQWECPT